MEKEILTVSSLACLESCPRQYYYRYEQELDYIYGDTEGLLIGSAFHKGMELQDPGAAINLVSRQVHDQFEADQVETMQSIVKGMVTGALLEWRHYDWTEKYSEYKFVHPIRNPETGYPSTKYEFRGKIDEVLRDGEDWWIREYKTTAQFPQEDYETRLKLNMQVTGYSWAAREIKPKGVLYSVARKPSIRQKKSETPQQFALRVCLDYVERPDFYFKEVVLSRSEQDLREFEVHLWEMTRLLSYYKRRNYWPRYTGRCGDWSGCRFMLLCAGDPDARAFYRHADKHSELQEEVKQLGKVANG